MEKPIQRTWADIDLGALRSNLDLIRSQVKSAEIMCIVKADAYGHGVEHIAEEFQSAGIKWFGVSNIDEAIELRRRGIEGDILILGYTAPEAVKLLSRHRITQSVFSEKYAKQLSEEARNRGLTVQCHLKTDTGMGRIGVDCRSDNAVETHAGECEAICRLYSLEFTGIFTHFAAADEGGDGREFTFAQYERFTRLIEILGQRGITFRWRHCCNSAATLEYPHMHLDMVRPGIILYGLAPSHELDGKFPLKPVMQLRSVVSMVKELEEGATVSYGRTFTAPHKMTVATVPIGYADGFPRVLSSRQDMIVRGKRVPIIGRVCMDQLMLDVSGVEGICEGDIVTAFGCGGTERIPIEELSDKLGTINYELVCRLSRRVPRVYYRDGRVFASTEYLSK